MLKKVLVVEDSTLLAKMYRTVFGFYPGCELVYAENGLEALDKLALESPIDLIVLDINMPQMDGLTFLKEMQTKGWGSVPVIVISTEGADDDIRRALQAGARAFVKKPWKPLQVRELIAKVVPGAGRGSW